MATAISQVIVVAVVGLVLWWLQRKMPAPELTDNGPNRQELQSRYEVWSLIAVFGNLVMWIPVTALLYAGLYPLVTWYSSGLRDNPETFVFCVPVLAYLIPVFFVGILLSSLVMAGILKLLLRDRFAEFARYDNLRSGIDQSRLMRHMIPTIGVSSIVGFLWMLNVYLVATPTELKINRPFGWARRYSYSELTEVMTAPATMAKSGARVQRRVYRLQFQDGSFYSTLFMPTKELDGRSVELLIDAILQRSGLTLQEKAVFEQGELEF